MNESPNSVIIHVHKNNTLTDISVWESGKAGQNRYDMEFNQGEFCAVRAYHDGTFVGHFIRLNEDVIEGYQIFDAHRFTSLYSLKKGQRAECNNRGWLWISMSNDAETGIVKSGLFMNTKESFFRVTLQDGTAATFSYSPQGVEYIKEENNAYIQIFDVDDSAQLLENKDNVMKLAVSTEIKNLNLNEQNDRETLKQIESILLGRLKLKGCR